MDHSHMIHWSKLSQGNFSTLPTVLQKSRARAHMLHRSKRKKTFLPPASLPQEKKVSARARVFSPPPKSTFLLSHTPSSHNTAHKLAGEIGCKQTRHAVIKPIRIVTMITPYSPTHAEAHTGAHETLPGQKKFYGDAREQTPQHACPNPNLEKKGRSRPWTKNRIPTGTQTNNTHIADAWGWRIAKATLTRDRLGNFDETVFEFLPKNVLRKRFRGAVLRSILRPGAHR